MNSFYYIVLISIFLFTFLKLPRNLKYEKLKYLSLWVLIILLFVFIYSLKSNIKYYVKNNNFLAYLIPGNGQLEGEVIRFKKSSDGHFYIIAKINDVSIKFLVDTGATDTLLSMSDAVKVRINVESLNYTDHYITANGSIYAAPIRIKKLSIAGKNFYDIKMAVSNSKMESSLLGMSFLENFYFTIEDDTLSIQHRSQ